MQFVINKDRIAKKKAQSNVSLVKAGIYLETILKNSVNYDTGAERNSITTQQISLNHIRVGSNTIQAYIEEIGRKPGKFPNLNALVGWAGRHGFISGSKTQGYDSLSSKDKGMVFILGRSIARKGIKAKGTFTKVWQENKTKAIQIYLDNMRR